MEEYQYKNGLMEGKRILYWKNGNLKEKNFLRKGAITGVSEFFIIQMVIQERLFLLIFMVDEMESGLIIILMGRSS